MFWNKVLSDTMIISKDITDVLYVAVIYKFNNVDVH